MRVFAIDPGTTESAWVQLRLDYRGDGADPILERFGYVANDELLVRLMQVSSDYVHPCDYIDALVIEKVESYGMAVGAEVFETVFWSGRFAQVWPRNVVRIGRGPVKMHLCHSMRAKDGNIRQALIDRFTGGAGEKAAKGTKKNPGPLYGVSGDVWAALAVGVTYLDQQQAALVAGG